MNVVFTSIKNMWQAGYTKTYIAKAYRNEHNERMVKFNTVVDVKNKARKPGEKRIKKMKKMSLKYAMWKVEAEVIKILTGYEFDKPKGLNIPAKVSRMKAEV